MIKWLWLTAGVLLVNIVVPSVACWLMSMKSWAAFFAGGTTLLILISVDIVVVRSAWVPLTQFIENTIESFTNH